jgi:hypothetical protein
MMQPPPAPAAWMRIVFPPPGFFLNDPRFTVLVNGWCAYDAGFKSGFDVRFPVVPGPCLVQTRLDIGLISREKSYSVIASEGYAIEVFLEYSRFWGNLTDSPRIGYVPLNR